MALLLAAGFTAPARTCLAQSPAAPLPQASAQKSAPAAATTVKRPKAHGKKVAPVAEAPQTPPAPPTLEQQPPTLPQVSYQNGQLSIDARNATLSQVLRSVQAQTGASIDMPPGGGSERVVAKLGPGKPKDVLSSLLNGSRFNYVILGSPNGSGGVQKVILIAKSTSGAEPSVNTAQNSPPPAAEPSDDEVPQNEPEPEVQPMQVQNGVPGEDGAAPEAPNNGLNQVPPGGKTPEQMLQELQRMQQQQQQLQQQLNPSNQQPGAFPIQPQAEPQ
jgi:hypothetical protein